MNDPFELSESRSATPGLAYLEGLNPSQREAVETTEGPVLMLAGAGTGKTRALTTRLAHILNQGKAGPWQILAVTFTNKAAKELRERVAGLVGRQVDGWWVGTFHALGARMLRAHADAVGLKSNFTILDADDQLRLVKQEMESLGLDEKRNPPRSVLSTIQRWKDRGLMPDRVTPAEMTGNDDGDVLELFKNYQSRLKSLNAADFGDLLLLCLDLFRARPEVLEQYRRQFAYILVDEYQDTNVAQYLWLRALAGRGGNICCVGDDDQSIYSWRGAEVGNILRFEEDFPGARVIRLERNYRSTPHILGAASGLIANNESRLGKTLWTDVDEGEKVRIQGLWDGDEEARFVCDEILALRGAGGGLGDMAILVRAGFQTRSFEERLMVLGIPYRVVGGPRFYERQEIRDAVAYLRVLAQPDDDLAFERIVNLPRRGIGKASLQAVHIHARAGGLSLTRAIGQLLETDELRPAVRSTLRGLMEDFARWRAMLEAMPHAEVAATLLEESGYVGMWRADRTPEAPGRLENLKELVNALDDFEDLGSFLEHVSLVMENEEAAAGERLTLMTLHGAKGLEFGTVFLPGWEEGLFPHQKAVDQGGLEEERRLAYVGITRARRLAVISFVANRHLFGQWINAVPSRFIGELPSEHVVMKNRLSGGRGGFAQARSRLEAMESVRASSSSDFVVGQRVFHQKFGYGRIRAMDGNRLDVDFEKAGSKKVIDSFVEAV